jgi:hypothetical protein
MRNEPNMVIISVDYDLSDKYIAFGYSPEPLVVII